MSKQKILVIFTLVAIIAAGGTFAAIWAIKSAQTKQTEEKASAIQQDIFESDCSNESVSELEPLYDQLASAQQKAEVAALIAQCAGGDIMNMPKAIEWSKKARDNFKEAGDEERFNQLDNYVNMFEPMFSTPPDSGENTPDANTEIEYIGM